MNAKSNLNRPYTSHDQNPQIKEGGQERDSGNQHKNPTHQTDPNSHPENKPKEEEE